MSKHNIECRIFGRGTVEVIERPGYTPAGDPRIVGPAPYGNVWVRREARSISYSTRNGGFSIDFWDSYGTGWFPEGNVRNAVWDAAADAALEAAIADPNRTPYEAALAVRGK